MTTQFSTPVRNARAQAVEDTIGTSAKFKIFGGAAKPATPATADAGSQLAEMDLPSNWMDDPDGGEVAKLGTWEDTSADATGLARYYRIYDSGESACGMQGLVSMPWEASTEYALNVQVNNGGLVYICTTAGTSAGSGGPTGTGTGITDGSAEWDYVGTVGLVLQNVSIASTQPVAVSSFTITEGNAGT